MNRSARRPRPAPRTAGFTMIELLVAVAISVMVLSILTMIFKLATQNTREANIKVQVTERLRTLNIRLSQEFGAMLPVARLAPGGKSYPDKRTFEIDSSAGRWFAFASATVENGRQVNTDVKYEFLEDPSDTSKSVLIRWRDKTGPWTQDPKTREWKVNEKYVLGDNEEGKSWEKPTDGQKYYQGDVLLTNVKKCKFELMDIPPGMPGSKLKAAEQTQLNPRELPAAVQVTVEFGPEGTDDRYEKHILVFPVYRGL